MPNLQRIIYFLFICLLLAGCVTAVPSTTVSTSSPLPSPTTPFEIITQIPTAQPTPASTPQGTWISLDPASGIPGTVVHIDGYLPGGLPPADLKSTDYATYASVCWSGCKNGLEEDGLEVTWSRTAPGHFSLEFTVPPIPWLAIDGFHPLEVGDYSIDLINLDPSKIGCSSSESCPITTIASATFHLTQSAVYPPCQEQYCGSLIASPAQAAPGERVQVKGWAPVVQYVDGPFGYNLVLETQGNTTPENVMYLAVQQSEAVQQAMDGSLTASFLVPQYGNDGSALSPGSYTLALEAPLTGEKNAFPILVAPTPFEIAAAPSWSGYTSATPLWIQAAADLSGSSMTADPLNSARLAYCASGAIHLSQDAGQSWTTLPVDAAGLPPPSELLEIAEQQPTCVSVALDSSHPDSLYAVFDWMDKEYGAPPIYYVGYFTSDLGKTWQPVPIPALDTSQQLINGMFGGFWTDGQVVQVLYFGKPSAENEPFPLLAKQTSDGGLSWNDASLACPASGLCLRWGAIPGSVGGMGADLPQEVLVSTDAGKTWSDTGQSIELRMTGPHELVAFSASDALLLSGTSRFPLIFSTDSGRTWRAFSLPELPGSQAGYFTGYPGLQLLPDGSLVAMLSDTGEWMRLLPTAQEWCLTGFTSPGQFSSLLTFAGGQVWWVSPTTLQPESAPHSALDCRK